MPETIPAFSLDRAMPSTHSSRPDDQPARTSVLGDLQNPRLIWTKGILFCVLGVLSASVLLARMPGLTEAALLCISIWAFCRAYYFAFYVIQHYVDPQFKFDGLAAFLKYAIKSRR